MGLFNFVKKFRQRRELKKLEKIEDKIWNNLVLLSQGEIDLGSCIATLAYFTDEQISRINNFSNSSDEIIRHLICFYVKYFKSCLENENLLPPFGDRGIAKWVAINAFENDNTLKENTLEEYERNLSKYFKDIDRSNSNTKSALISNISVNIYNTYPHRINLRTEKSLENIKKIISINSDNFDQIIKKTETPVLLKNFPENCRRSEDLGKWWF